MRFQVPQFIDVEDKLLGPVTAKGFAWLLGGVFICVPVYFFSDLSLFLVVAIPVMGAAGLFAFYRPYGKSFFAYVVSIMQYFMRPRLYLWQKTPEQVKAEEEAQKKGDYIPEKTPDFAIMPEAREKSISVDRLATLAKKLDVLSDKYDEELAAGKDTKREKQTAPDYQVVQAEAPEAVMKKVEAPELPYGFGSAPRPSLVSQKKKVEPYVDSGPQITYDEPK